MTIELINKLFALGVVAGQVAIVAAVLHFIFFRKKPYSLATFISQRGLLLAFIISLVATAGSLFYSQIAGFEPCQLCWFQRIFMYPEVLLLGLALLKKDSSIVDYALSLSIVGGALSLYHNYIYYSNGGLNAICQVLGQGVSCMKRYVFELGYVTIPMMSLTTFLLMIVLLVMHRMYIMGHMSIGSREPKS